MYLHTLAEQATGYRLDRHAARKSSTTLRLDQWEAYQRDRGPSGVIHPRYVTADARPLQPFLDQTSQRWFAPLRGKLGPAVGTQIVSVEWKWPELHALADLSGDRRLAGLLAADDPYAAVAGMLPRKAGKEALLMFTFAMPGGRRVAEASDDAQALFRGLHDQCSDASSWLAQERAVAKREQRQPLRTQLQAGDRDRTRLAETIADAHLALVPAGLWHDDLHYASNGGLVIDRLYDTIATLDGHMYGHVVVTAGPTIGDPREQRHIRLHRTTDRAAA